MAPSPPLLYHEPASPVATEYRVGLSAWQDKSMLLGYVLFQMAPWVTYGPEALDYLASLPEWLPGMTVAVQGLFVAAQCPTMGRGPRHGVPSEHAVCAALGPATPSTSGFGVLVVTLGALALRRLKRPLSP